jgi:L-lactate dehydrogenase complex protein LldG
MSSGRDEILSNIRRSLGVSGREAPRHAAVNERLKLAAPGIVPQRGDETGAERIALFRRYAEAVQATVALVAGPAEVPQAVAAYLRDQNLPATLRMGDDPRLAAMPWQETALAVTVGPSAGGDLNAVSHAYAGVAETGTLVMVSGHANPTTLNFLPDNHVVVLDASDLVGHYEDVWARLRGGEMPRTVNWITGPSRSADIERTLLLGAHGPRSLHIVVVTDSSAQPAGA